MIACLGEQLGEKRLVRLLVDNFVTLGEEGKNHADESWKLLGLDTERRTDIGLALQALIEAIDQTVEKLEIDELSGIISIEDSHVAFNMTEGRIGESIEGYRVAIAQKNK